MRVPRLLQELEEVRAEKESLKVGYEQQLRNHQRQILEGNCALKTIESENSGLKTKVSHLEEESRKSISSLENMQEELAKTEVELERNRGQFETFQHQFKYFLKLLY